MWKSGLAPEGNRKEIEGLQSSIEAPVEGVGDLEIVSFTTNDKSNYSLIFIKQWSSNQSVINPGYVLFFLITSVEPLEISRFGIYSSECDLYYPFHPKNNGQQMWENVSKKLIIKNDD